MLSFLPPVRMDSELISDPKAARGPSRQGKELLSRSISKTECGMKPTEALKEREELL
jgi:hypothetical protein